MRKTLSILICIAMLFCMAPTAFAAYNTGDPVDVIFDVQGIGTAPAKITGAVGSTITAPTAPTQAGYTFAGWYKEVATTNVWNFTSDKLSSPTTLYAKWTPIKYNVGCADTYVASNYTTTTNGTYTVAYGTSNTALTAVTQIDCGATVTVTPVASSGYEVAKVYYVETGKTQENLATKEINGTYTFKVPAFDATIHVLFTLQYDLWVSDIRVTDFNKTDILGDGLKKVIYDDLTNTLTIDGANISGNGIYADVGTLTDIDIKNTSSIVATTTDPKNTTNPDGYGIYCDGALNITYSGAGTGTLAISACSGSSSYGIKSTSLTIGDNMIVNVSSGSATNFDSIGIDVDNTTASGTVQIGDSTLNVNSGKSDTRSSYGISAYTLNLNKDNSVANVVAGSAATNGNSIGVVAKNIVFNNSTNSNAVFSSTANNNACSTLTANPTIPTGLVVKAGATSSAAIVVTTPSTSTYQGNKYVLVAKSGYVPATPTPTPSTSPSTALTALSFSQSEITLTVLGSTKDLSTYLVKTPSTATNSITYTTVSTTGCDLNSIGLMSNGKVTAKENGFCYVRAISDNSLTADIKVIVQIAGAANYKFIYNRNGSWYYDSPKDYTVEVNGPYTSFSYVTLNGTTINPSNYITAKDTTSGYTIITLYKSYMQTLSHKTYQKLRVYYSDGSYAETNLHVMSVYDTPITGDTNYMPYWITLFVSTIGLGAVLVLKKKFN